MNANSKMYSTNELAQQIQQGKSFLVAGDEGLLKQLPKGNWIGGTIPYFMSENGGVITKDKLYATELPSYIKKATVRFYDETSIQNIYTDAPLNGFTVIIIPALSKIHLSFATNTPDYKDFATRPVIGWISGAHLSDLGKVTPKVIDGITGVLSDQKAVVMQVELTEHYVADMGIVNIFQQGNGDTVEFLENGFTVTDAMINGKKMNFAEYVQSKNLDVKLPMVANYGGAMINVSFQSVDAATKQVNFYAPVFKGVQYKQAAHLADYVSSFKAQLPKDTQQIVFSCNCILNFLYSELEGKKTADITGPITFGEVAYQLLNQTMVYLNIQKI